MPDQQTPADRPLAIYLDWNVMQGVIDGHLHDLEDLLLVGRASGRLVVPYSFEHVTEATRGLDRTDPRTSAVIDGIAHITGSVFWRLEGGQVLQSLLDPRQLPLGLVGVLAGLDDEPVVAAMAEVLMPAAKVFARQALEAYRQPDPEKEPIEIDDLLERLETLPDTMAAIVDISELLVQAGRRASQLMEDEGFDPCKLGNAAPGEIVGVLDAVLQQQDPPTTIGDLLALWRENVAQHGTAGFDTPAMNALLGFFGYRRDGEKTTDASVQSDSNHLEFAKVADMFVTRDRRLRARASAVMEERGVVTQVLNVGEAVGLLSQALADVQVVEVEQEPDGSWCARRRGTPGTCASGDTKDEAVDRLLADQAGAAECPS